MNEVDKSVTTIELDTAGIAECFASLAALAKLSPKIRDALFGILDRLPELLAFEQSAASGAGKIGLALQPTDAFREALSALRTIDGQFSIVEETRHGWPILSVGARTPTVAERGGRRTSSPGGAA